MSAVTTEKVSSGSARSSQFHLWRSRKDKLARWLIAVGGVAVIWMVVLIFFYLLWVVAPLFLPADTEYHPVSKRPAWMQSGPVWLAIEEQQSIGLRISENGQGDFFRVSDGSRVKPVNFPFPRGTRISKVAETPAGDRIAAVATGDRQVYVFRHDYETDYSAGVEARTVVPSLHFPYGNEPLFEWQAGTIVDLAVSDSDRQLLVAALSSEGEAHLYRAEKRENLLTGEVTLDPVVSSQPLQFPPAQGGRRGVATGAGISGDHRWLYVGDSLGRLHRYALPDLEWLDS
ncbi:MAG: LpqB family beta-propeller domain-containing protein, partial [Xanthomonadales bacterium]|nr:LpqB family beta-propeller domain-containing protein [Xanthomonadales bacterium]